MSCPFSFLPSGRRSIPNPTDRPPSFAFVVLFAVLFSAFCRVDRGFCDMPLSLPESPGSVVWPRFRKVRSSAVGLRGVLPPTGSHISLPPNLFVLAYYPVGFLKPSLMLLLDPAHREGLTIFSRFQGPPPTFAWVKAGNTSWTSFPKAERRTRIFLARRKGISEVPRGRHTSLSIHFFPHSDPDCVTAGLLLYSSYLTGHPGRISVLPYF